MKKLIDNYSFSAANKTVTFLDFNFVDLKRVLLITNVTDGIIIYNFADSTKGATNATNVLTLEYDTTSMSDTDSLQIYYDAVEVNDEKKENEMIMLLRGVIEQLKEINLKLT